MRFGLHEDVSLVDVGPVGAAHRRRDGNLNNSRRRHDGFRAGRRSATCRVLADLSY